jgi:hypothetical protein
LSFHLFSIHYRFCEIGGYLPLNVTDSGADKKLLPQKLWLNDKEQEIFVQ